MTLQNARPAVPLALDQIGSTWEPVWANNAAAGTRKTTTIATGDRCIAEYSVLGCNPSDRSDLLVRAYNIEPTFGPAVGGSVDVLVDEWTIPKSTILTIEDCEDDWTIPGAQGANVSATADTTATKEGTNNVPIVVGASAVAGMLAYENFTAINTIDYTHIRLWAMSTVTTAAGDFILYLTDTNGGVSSGTPETLLLPALTANVWKRCYIPTARVALAAVSIAVSQVVHTHLTLRLDDIQAMRLSRASFTARVESAWRCRISAH
jgi:hypothetical protein